jgi:hypothetical protein
MNRWRGHVLAAALLTVTACSQSDEDTSLPDTPVEDSDSVEWKPGSDDIMVWRSKDRLVRCWPLRSGYDCIDASRISAQGDGPGAPDVRYYFRFQTPSLPATLKTMEKFSVADGYRCQVTRRDNIVTLREMIWQNGYAAVVRKSDQIGTTIPWTLQDVNELSAQYGFVPENSYFLCMMMDNIVVRDDLVAIDSPLLVRDRFFPKQWQFKQAPAEMAPAVSP